jgi:hypothetical protein
VLSSSLVEAMQRRLGFEILHLLYLGVSSGQHASRPFCLNNMTYDREEKRRVDSLYSSLAL